MNRKYVYVKITASMACALMLMLVVSPYLSVHGKDTNANVLGAFYTPTRRATYTLKTSTTVRTGVYPTATPSRVPTVVSLRSPTTTPTLAPTVVPTNKPQESVQSGNSGLESQTISLINAERQRQNLGQLSTDGALTNAARRHAADMCDHNNFSHTGTDGSDFSKRAKDAGYSGFAYGEVIGWQHSSAESIFNGWMQSPPHHDIILYSSVNKIGVGWSGNCVVGVVGS